MAIGTSNPPKRARQECMLDCCESDPKATLTTLTDYSSWQTVLRAANIRKYEPIQHMGIGLAEGQYPCIYYH